MSGPNKILKLLAVYGNTGGEKELTNIFEKVKSKQKFGSVHQSLALKVRNKLLQTIEDHTRPDLRHFAWSCLGVLCLHDFNSNADGFLFNLQDTNILMWAKLRFQQEPNVIVSFLWAYAMKNNIRCQQILEQEGLLRDLLSVVESFVPENFSEADRVFQSEALKSLASLLESPNCALKFVALGGRNILHAMLSKMATTCRTISGAGIHEFIPVLDCCALACLACNGMVQRNHNQLMKAWNREEFPDSCISYTLEQALGLMQSWYFVLRCTMHWGRDVVKEFMLAESLKTPSICAHYLDPNELDRAGIIRTANYEEDVCAAFQNIYLFRGAMQLDGEISDAEAPTFIQFVVNVVREQKYKIDFELLSVARTYLPLLALVEEHAGKVHFCAHPECHISSLLPKRLKKCERCMSAWYCSREHQVAHWKAGHKQVCKRREEGTVVETSASTECAAVNAY